MKVKFGPLGQEVEVTKRLVFEVLDEPWTEILVEDGTRILVRFVAVRVRRAIGVTAPNGDPVYHVEGPILIVTNPKEEEAPPPQGEPPLPPPPPGPPARTARPRNVTKG
jgi:hypothetical protein